MMDVTASALYVLSRMATKADEISAALADRPSAVDVCPLCCKLTWPPIEETPQSVPAGQSIIVIVIRWVSFAGEA